MVNEENIADEQIKKFIADFFEDKNKPVSNNRQIEILSTLIFKQGYPQLLQLCHDISFLEIICQAQRLGLSTRVNGYRETPSQNAVISLIMNLYTDIAALELLNSRQVDIHYEVAPLEKCKPELHFLEVYAYSNLYKQPLSSTNDVKPLDLRYFGLKQIADAYEFTHPILTDYYCARYIANCFLQENNEYQKSLFPTRHHWHNQSVTIRQFIAEEADNPRLQRMWMFVENLLPQKNYNKILEEFITLKKQRELMQEITQNYQFKVVRENEGSLRIVFHSSLDKPRKQASQIIRLYELLLIEAKARDITTLVLDDNEFNILISAEKSKIDQLLSWLDTFNSSYLLKKEQKTTNFSERFFQHSSQRVDDYRGEFDCKLQ